MMFQSTTKIWRDIRKARKALGQNPDKAFWFEYLYDDEGVNKSLAKENLTYLEFNPPITPRPSTLYLDVDPKSESLGAAQEVTKRYKEGTEIAYRQSPFPPNKELLRYISKNSHMYKDSL